MSETGPTQETSEETAREGERNLREAHDREKARADAAEAHARDTVFEAVLGEAQDSKLGELFRKGYEGEVSVGAVRAAWTELAPVPAEPTPTPEPVTDTGDADRRLLATGGAAETVPPEPVMDPVGDGEKAFRDRMQAGASREVAAAEAYSRFFDDAVKQGSQSKVVWDEFKHREALRQEGR